MKFIGTLLLLLSIQFCFAQSYHPFPDSNATWTSESYSCFTPFGTTDAACDHNGGRIAMGNDTIINSKHYRLIGTQALWHYETYNEDVTEMYNYPIDPPGIVFGGIREDSSKRIWFISFVTEPDACQFYFSSGGAHHWPLVNTEFLLYDFNLLMGQEVTITEPYQFNNYTRIVQSVDSIQLIDGSWRKRYNFQNPLDYWVEGIGSSLGLFGVYSLPDDQDVCYCGCWLNYFSLNGQTLFEKPDITSGITIDSLNVISDLLDTGISGVKCVPNLFAVSTKLSFYLPEVSPVTLIVYDMNGRPVKSLIENETMDAGNHSVSFWKEQNPAGMYFYVLRAGDKTEVGKMILMY